MFFKVKKETKMQKIMDAYASRRGISASSLRFMLDGERVQPEVGGMVGKEGVEGMEGGGVLVVCK